MAEKKTRAEITRDYRERLKEQGLTEVKIQIPIADKARALKYAARLRASHKRKAL